MKHFYLSLLTLIMFGMSVSPNWAQNEQQRVNSSKKAATADNYLEIVPFTIQQGTTKKTVTLDMINKDRITAFQCDIIFPEGIEIESTINGRGKIVYTQPTFNTTANRTDNSYHTLTFNKIEGAEGLYRLIVYSTAKEEILGNNGAVLDLSLVFNENLAPGEYNIKINDVVITKMDNTDEKPTEYICKVTVSADANTFAAYKTTKKSDADALEQDGDSDAVKELISTAKNTIDALAYDEAISLTKNKEKVDNIISTLENDIKKQREAEKLAADKAAFNEYKGSKKTEAEAMGQSGDSDAVKNLISTAKNSIDALAYNESITLAENKTVVDGIINELGRKIDAQRIADKLAADKAAFNEYKNNKKGIADAMGQSDDSDAVKNLIATAKNSIDALAYDESISLDDNKAKVDKIINDLSSAIITQREEDKLAADIAAFNECKDLRKMLADALAKDGDSQEILKMIEDAKNEIDALVYNRSKTLDENRNFVYAIVNKLETDINAQRKADKLAADIAAFDEYKSRKKGEAEAMEQSGDSQAVKDLIKDATNSIDALTYDESLTLDNNKAKVDEIINVLGNAIKAQREAEKLAADKAAFAEYKSDKKEEAGTLTEDGDSEKVLSLITNAQSAIEALTYDETQSLDNNKAKVDEIINNLKKNITDQRIADKASQDEAAFIEYKIAKKAVAEGLAQDGDSEAVQQLINDAKTEIDNLKYDESASLDENKAKVDDIFNELGEKIKAQREADKLAADKAAFDEYKNGKKVEAQALAQEGDSEAVQQLIDDANDAIDNLKYDEAASLDENKAKVDDIFNELGEKIKAQREADKLAADKAAFDEYKNGKKVEAQALAQEGDAQEVLNLIEKAQNDIDALNYDESRSLDENKAVVDGIIDQLQEDVKNARIAVGIYGIKTSNGKAKIHTLDGKKIDRIFKSGFYIINGEKRYVNIR